MIRICGNEDEGKILNIINEAARGYRDAIPGDVYRDPYMPLEELRKEMSEMTFLGYEERGELVGVAGYQRVMDVTLVRHVYVLPKHQRRGIGKKLLTHILRIATTERILVGTWKSAIWAIRFYEKNRFKLQPDKDALLRKYWKISTRQIELSVVLGIQKPIGTLAKPS